MTVAIDFTLLEEKFAELFASLSDAELASLRKHWNEVASVARTRLLGEIANRNAPPGEVYEPVEIPLAQVALQPAPCHKERSGPARLLVRLGAVAGAVLLCKGIYFILMTQ